MFSLLSLILKPRAALRVSANDAKRIILKFHLPSVSLVQRSQAATKDNHIYLIFFRSLGAKGYFASDEFLF